MIEIRSLFTDWHEASLEEARKYIEGLLSRGMPAISSKEGKTAYINREQLRGITVEELIKE